MHSRCLWGGGSFFVDSPPGNVKLHAEIFQTENIHAPSIFTPALLIVVFCSFKKKKKIRWNKIFKSRIIQTVALYGNTSFMVVIAILIFLLIGTFIPDITGFDVVCTLSWKRNVRPQDSAEPGEQTFFDWLMLI